MKSPPLPLWRMPRSRYDRLVEAGIFGPEDRIELLDGLLVAREPQGARHATVVGLVRAALEKAFGLGPCWASKSPTRRSRSPRWAQAARPSPWRAVVAATVLNAPLGSLYAFSVFLKPLEALLGLSRADLTLVFALASGGFGAGMILAPLFFGLAATSTLVLACATASALGIAVAATAGGLLQLAVGYGVLFGAGGGAAYILAQQAVNLAVTRRHGLVNGYIVGLYPAGAMVAR